MAVQLRVHRAPWARGRQRIALGPSDTQVSVSLRLRRKERAFPKGGCRGNGALNKTKMDRMDQEAKSDLCHGDRCTEVNVWWVQRREGEREQWVSSFSTGVHRGKLHAWATGHPFTRAAWSERPQGPGARWRAGLSDSPGSGVCS